MQNEKRSGIGNYFFISIFEFCMDRKGRLLWVITQLLIEPDFSLRRVPTILFASSIQYWQRRGPRAKGYRLENESHSLCHSLPAPMPEQFHSGVV